MNNRTKRLLMLLEDGGRKTVSGVPPLIFKSDGSALKNYRIYGNTVDGESVGDRTGNLWNENYSNDRLTYVPIMVGNGEFTMSTTVPNAGMSEGSPAANLFFLTGNVVAGASTGTNGIWAGNPRTIESSDGYVTVAYRTQTFGERFNPKNYDTMLNVGNSVMTYEPYGYKVPVTVADGNDTVTTNIYLPEQIRKVGDEAEYIDFEEQKQHFADGTSVDVELPALPTLSGTNTLSVGTTVQPSKVEVMGKIKAVSAQPVLLSRQISDSLLFGSENELDEPHQSAVLTASPDWKPSFDVSEQLKGDDEYADDQSGYSSDENDLGDNSENTDDFGSDSEVGRESAGSAGTGQ